MPTESTEQTHMKRFMGKAPNVDGNGLIDNIAFKRYIVNKTADYTVQAKESGALFTNYGITSDIEFTLPAHADGLEFEFVNCADVELKVSSADGDDIVTFNDLAADSIAYTDASKQIGGGMKLTSNGTVWIAQLFTYDGTDAPVTIAT